MPWAKNWRTSFVLQQQSIQKPIVDAKRYLPRCASDVSSFQLPSSLHPNEIPLTRSELIEFLPNGFRCYDGSSDLELHAMRPEGIGEHAQPIHSHTMDRNYRQSVQMLDRNYCRSVQSRRQELTRENRKIGNKHVVMYGAASEHRCNSIKVTDS